MNDEARQRLRDALTAAELITAQVQRQDKSRFHTDPWFRGAIERQIEIIGEALNHVRRSGYVTEDDIPSLHEWVALRNVMAHQYDRIDQQLVWDAITLDRELPDLMQTLRKVLGNSGST